MKKYVIVFLIWVMIIPIAILNGGFREYVLMMHLEILALPLSGIILSVCIFLVAYLFVPKIKGGVKRDYILFGVMWFVLTNLFDLSSYIKSGEGFAGLLQSYNILTGNTWILVVLHRHNHNERQHRNEQTSNERDCPQGDALKKAAVLNGCDNLLRQYRLGCRAEACGVHNG